MLVDPSAYLPQYTMFLCRYPHFQCLETPCRHELSQFHALRLQTVHHSQVFAGFS
jgi:hypothetical protein